MRKESKLTHGFWGPGTDRGVAAGPRKAGHKASRKAMVSSPVPSGANQLTYILCLKHLQWWQLSKRHNGRQTWRSEDPATAARAKIQPRMDLRAMAALFSLIKSGCANQLLGTSTQDVANANAPMLHRSNCLPFDCLAGKISQMSRPNT